MFAAYFSARLEIDAIIAVNIYARIIVASAAIRHYDPEWREFEFPGGLYPAAALSRR